MSIRPVWTTVGYCRKNSHNTSNNTTIRKLLAYQVFSFCHPGRLKRLRVIRLQDASPPPSLPERAPLHCCHGTRQCPLPDRADAMGTRAPREVPTGLTGTQEVTKEYAKRKYPEGGARAGISTGFLRKSSPTKCA